jgi:hypothetical protein
MNRFRLNGTAVFTFEAALLKKLFDMISVAAAFVVTLPPNSKTSGKLVVDIHYEEEL